ncbi:MAG: glycosyl transferase, group 1 [Candidatus Moranbacteria bacterium GW2011_GWE1_36_7]|nr:MAG: glycosyl transferase, group 1 [Candidatus Moranbacteria bacterium GW2011_GWD2_36_12]KKQ06645.1 MAG: glycosyl transferase, group 1 [Candidatus Moranbacteria bacterium GW2011_GWE2_36_40]KKQ15193.1 MAG: glycosyl transferase, group 1 [Candidatus Moranbacteria bacterium GW2011_GWE1_36_7]
MKIGIDARFFGLGGKGLGRYTQKLIEHLETIDIENQYVVFLRKENFDEYQPFNKNFTKVLADYRWYSFSEQILYPRLLAKYKFDLMHFPHFNVPLLYRKKFVLTIHDLILIHFPTLRGTMLNPIWYWIKYAAYKLTIGSAIKRSAAIIAVSEFTKNDIIGQYSEATGKIFVTYEASDNLCRISSVSPNQILEKYGIIKSYLLYVGNAYPHKNLESLIDAFELILEEFPNLQLALVGKEDFFYVRLKKYVIKNNISNVHFLGFVPDQDLDVLYRFAQAYVFPSLYEGFGLPPLEAMAKGAAVVCSDHACMKEVLGEAALYVDANPPVGGKNFAKGVELILNNKEIKDRLIERGYERIRKYSWEKMANETLSIYLNVRNKK